AHLADTFALVRLRRTERADLGSNLADHLLVSARDLDLGRLRRGERDAGGRLVDDRVRVTERQLEILALQRRAVTDADQFQILGEAGRNAGHHVLDVGARGAPHRLRLALVRVARGDGDFA